MTAEEKINEYIHNAKDLQGITISKIRHLIMNVQPEIVEEWVDERPVWSYKGAVCSAYAAEDHVELTFFHATHFGEGNTLFSTDLPTRSAGTIIIGEHDEINEQALGDLILEASKYNESLAS